MTNPALRLAVRGLHRHARSSGNRASRVRVRSGRRSPRSRDHPNTRRYCRRPDQDTEWAKELLAEASYPAAGPDHCVFCVAQPTWELEQVCQVIAKTRCCGGRESTSGASIMSGGTYLDATTATPSALRTGSSPPGDPVCWSLAYPCGGAVDEVPTANPESTRTAGPGGSARSTVDQSGNHGPLGNNPAGRFRVQSALLAGRSSRPS